MYVDLCGRRESLGLNHNSPGGVGCASVEEEDVCDWARETEAIYGRRKKQ